MKFDLRTGDTSDPSHVPHTDWTDWQEAQDNVVFEGEIRRYVQHRFYAWVPQDVRESRNRPELPQFIYKQFVLKWWGKKFEYYYRYRDEFFAIGPVHTWGFTDVGYGFYQFANWPRTSPTLYDQLPLFEV